MAALRQILAIDDQTRSQNFLVLWCCIFKSDGDLHPTVSSIVLCHSIVEFDFCSVLGSARRFSRDDGLLEWD